MKCFFNLFARRGFAWLPLQTPGTAARLGISDTALREEMKVLLANGNVLGGIDSWTVLMRSVWWLFPLSILLRVPGIHWMATRVYRWFARNRYCIAGACVVRKENRLSDWIPLVLLPTIAISTRNMLPAWVFMWTLAFALFFGCKWLTWRRAKVKTSIPRSLAYLFAWPGMDARNFLERKPVRVPTAGDWIFASAKTFAGAAIVCFAGRNVFQLAPLLNGWLGMFGIILFLHFGTFHLLALMWQRAGFDAKPLMRAPMRATSLADFWGVRWNTAFHLLAHDLLFRRFARRVGIPRAMLGVFLVSGIVHDLVISLPARGGYGLPTAYFLLQGAATLFERSAIGRAIGLGKGVRGWLFMFVITAAPAYWLFHPTFVRNVILPMLQTIGAN
jgi:alginate O-acetyltransferase complex protein AlgI